MVYGYFLILLIATPYLPSLIRWASSTWSGESVSRLVLGVEISGGILLIVLAGGIFFYNRAKCLRFLLITAGSIAAVALFYLVIPNPYELTHLPEYAVLSVLIMRAIKGGRHPSSHFLSAEDRSGPKAKLAAPPIPVFHHSIFRLAKRRVANSLYFQSALITTVLGTLDEVYQGLLPTRCFIWYDILLNALGGVLGLAVVWGISRE